MIEQKLEDDLKNALKGKLEVVVSAIRNVKADIKNVAIAKGEDLTDEEVLKVLAKKVKQHKDSIESFRTGNRSDLIKHEEDQLKVLEDYLPKQMSDEEVKSLVLVVVNELNADASDFGKVMKEVLLRANGKTDGSVVSKIVKQELNG
jgi:uncharacterized protein